MSDQTHNDERFDGEILDEGIAVKERPTTKNPRMYKVLLHNDDYTTMDFVVWILVEFFRKSETEAMQIMLHVHKKGIGMCGVFTFDEAETKIAQVTLAAQKHEHPLKCTMEPDT